MSHREDNRERRRSRSPRRDGRDRDREARDYRDPRHRDPRERDVRRYDDDDRYDRRGGGSGYRDVRDGRDDRRDGRGDRNYARGGRDPGRERERSPRPLDRRAIEEGRRRREEERMRGVKYAADGTRIEPEAPKEEQVQEEAPTEDLDDESAAIAAMMGFGGFGTTKGKEVEGNDVGDAKVNKKRTWRQYMNRRGGFNRALDKLGK